jgi:GH15 family glucan-1,4-alpha-glucosidase
VDPDASFSIYDLLGLGYADEVRAFGTWLRDRGADYTGSGDHPLKIMYRVDGSPTWPRRPLTTSRAGEHWDQPDEGVWETRGGREDFAYGRFQSWVALDRAERGWNSKVGAFTQHYGTDSLVYRYNPSASPDGLAGDEGTFTLCTFWYVDALAQTGRLGEARLTFEKMHTCANQPGLPARSRGC